MTTIRRWLRVPLLALTLAVGACSIGGDHVRWEEEVKLSNGQVITIQRHVELTETGFPVQNRGFNKFFEICYPPMGIHWKSRASYQPDIFDIVDGKAYMHVPVSSQFPCYEQHSPTTGAVYFRWDEDRWTRIGPEEFPAAAEWNLLMGVKSGTKKYDPKGHVSIDDKSRGKLADNTLRVDQKRFGWKRVSESYYYKDGCKPFKDDLKDSWCLDEYCEHTSKIPVPEVSIFYKDQTNRCLR